MREWWEIEKDSRDQLQIYDNFYFHGLKDNCYHSWETSINHYCADCTVNDPCEQPPDCKGRNTLYKDKKYCIKCQDSFDYCGKPYISLCHPSTALYPFIDNGQNTNVDGCSGEKL